MTNMTHKQALTGIQLKQRTRQEEQASAAAGCEGEQGELIN